MMELPEVALNRRGTFRTPVMMAVIAVMVSLFPLLFACSSEGSKDQSEGSRRTDQGQRAGNAGDGPKGTRRTETQAALVPIVHRRLGDFYGYLRAIEDSVMAGRGLRGHASRRTRAALGHALAFPTWRSLTREQGLGDGEAVTLMSVLVEGAASAG